MTDIYTMDEKTGKVERVAVYSLNPKQAIIAYVMQSRKNFNSWEYPASIPGIRESGRRVNHYYYDDMANGRIIAAYPREVKP